MQCPICKFNNLPGTRVCTRCRAQLILDENIAPEHLQPPRAGQYKKYRSIVYFFNRLDDHQLGKKTVTIAGHLLFLLLSLIPGLGHMVKGRRRAALAICCGWLSLMALIVLLYSSTLSGVLLGMAIALHAFVFFDILDIRSRYPKILSQFFAATVIAVIIAISYFGLQSYAHRFARIVISPCDFPQWHVQKQDSLLVTPGNNHGKGQLVYYHLPTSRRLRRGNLYFHLNWANHFLGCILGLSGDKIEVGTDGVIQINGNKVNRQYLNDQQMKPGKPFTLTVPPDCYFIPNQFIFRGNRIRQDNYIFLWKNAYIVPRKQVIGKAIAIYFPLARRRFFPAPYSGNNR